MGAHIMLATTLARNRRRQRRTFWAVGCRYGTAGSRVGENKPVPGRQELELYCNYKPGIFSLGEDVVCVSGWQLYGAGGARCEKHSVMEESWG